VSIKRIAQRIRDPRQLARTSHSRPMATDPAARPHEHAHEQRACVTERGNGDWVRAAG